MTLLYYILGLTLLVLFFLNINTAAQMLCKIAGGLSILFLYAPLSCFLPPVGINLLTASVLAVFNLPGGVLLVLLSAVF